MKQIKDPDSKGKIKYQVFISAAFVLGMFCALFSHIKVENNGIKENFASGMIETTEKFAADINGDISECIDHARIAATLYAKEGAAPVEYMSTAVSAGIFDHMYVVDADGIGTDENGADLDVSDTDYWEKANRSADSQRLISISEDGSRAVVDIEKLQNGDDGYVIVVYAASKIGLILGAGDYDNLGVYMLTDAAGNVIYANETGSEFSKLMNLWEPEYSGSTSEAGIKSAMATGTVMSGYLDTGKEKRLISTAPVGNTGLCAVTAVSDGYMSRLYSKTYASVRRLRTAVICLIVMYCILQFGVTFLRGFKEGQVTRELEEKADTDLLTGLCNKLATERRIKEYMSSHPDTPCMMILFDIDKFKKINDTMGHAFGDEVLKTLGETVTAQFRVTDIIGRVGGDEFMVFLKDISGEDLEKREAEKLMEFFRQFKAGSYVKYSATASVGVAMFPRDGGDFETLYKAADEALYRSKEGGRNQLNFHDPERPCIHG